MHFFQFDVRRIAERPNFFVRADRQPPCIDGKSHWPFKVRARVESPFLVAQTTNNLLACYVLTRNDASTECSCSTGLSYWVP